MIISSNKITNKEKEIEIKVIRREINIKTISKITNKIISKIIKESRRTKANKRIINNKKIRKLK
jgi:hypothetical protein